LSTFNAQGFALSRQKYRLVTRSDFDGLVCAVLMRELDLIDEILFVHPKDMQDGKIDITGRDITTNVPYVASAHLAFDHHASEAVRIANRLPNHIIVPDAPSTARVVYEHFGGALTFPSISRDMLAAVDKADSAQFALQDILDPQGWVMLNYLMDARTGLGRFREFRISNYQLMLQLIEHCRTMHIERILALPDVEERVQLYRQHQRLAARQIQQCSKVFGNVVVLDLRDQETIYATNRFVIYALFPQCNVSIHVMWGLRRQNTVFAIGKSILDRSARVDVGALCLRYGGGGHKSAGTCQVENSWATRVLPELIAAIHQSEFEQGSTDLG
jgi:nanoRNase/pAp phosphatase (c-di-AMP/oligoRNAs hydrolase)